MLAEVRVQGNLVQVWARYQARFGEPGNVVEWSGVDALTLMKPRRPLAHRGAGVRGG